MSSGGPELASAEARFTIASCTSARRWLTQTSESFGSAIDGASLADEGRSRELLGLGFASGGSGLIPMTVNVLSSSFGAKAPTVAHGRASGISHRLPRDRAPVSSRRDRSLWAVEDSGTRPRGGTNALDAARSKSRAEGTHDPEGAAPQVTMT
ncbi:MAG: hypothetical protein BGO98_35960 [Myxococcales bacterium 68-20]|nr:MAG: hypothetical protein BGO98_35960 [Myxococcales bacterium 68-20]